MKRLLHMLISIVLIAPLIVNADVKTDFEIGSGGMNTNRLEDGVQTLIYALLMVFAAWVMINSIKKLIDADEGEYYPIIGDVLRATAIMVVMVLTLT